MVLVLHRHPAPRRFRVRLAFCLLYDADSQSSSFHSSESSSGIHCMKERPGAWRYCRWMNKSRRDEIVSRGLHTWRHGSRSFAPSSESSSISSSSRIRYQYFKNVLRFSGWPVACLFVARLLIITKGVSGCSSGRWVVGSRWFVRHDYHSAGEVWTQKQGTTFFFRTHKRVRILAKRRWEQETVISSSWGGRAVARNAITSPNIRSHLCTLLPLTVLALKCENEEKRNEVIRSLAGVFDLLYSRLFDFDC